MRFEVTPIIDDGTLFLNTPRNRVLALSADSGQLKWSFDPEIDLQRRYPEGLTVRGVSLWRNAQSSSRSCDRRVFLTTVDSRLIALDARSGRPCKDFGTRGQVRIDEVLFRDVDETKRTHVTITSPPIVVGSVVIGGIAVANDRTALAASGAVWALDAVSGEVKWTFRPLAQSSSLSLEAIEPQESSPVPGGDVWSMITADVERGVVFVPTGSAAPAFYGGNRRGTNKMASSVVALKASTGELVWSYQFVHHDLWDYDVAAPPLLVTVNVGGAEKPVVIVGTKTGMIYVLDRLSGKPLHPIEELPTPRSDVPGESTWPTQPFSTGFPSFYGGPLTRDSIFGITRTDLQYCRDWMAKLRYDGIFTPPSMRGSLFWPGVWGGMNWDAFGWDPARKLLIVSVKRLGVVVQLRRRGDRIRKTDLHVGQEFDAQEGAPYVASRMPFVAPSGTPCSSPPWGTLTAIDVSERRVRWQKPLGSVPWLRSQRGYLDWGSINFGGPLVTAGGLVFIAASQDEKIRALDIESGKTIWSHDLPAGGQASPMTYVHDGTQFVLISAGGRSGIGTPGDWLTAFALPAGSARTIREK